jgi:signal transduction histidine kinase
VLAAVVVVGAALGIANVILIVELNASQIKGVDSALRLELNSVVATSKNGTFPQPIQVSSQETSFIQIVDAKGRVLTSSASVEGESRIVSFIPGSQAAFHTKDNLPIGSGDRYRVAALEVNTPSGRVIIYAGESLAAIDRSVHDVLAGLLLVDPILLVIVGFTVWWLVRRALFPVEAIRSEVAEISASELDRRVAEPAVMDEIGRLATTMNDMLDRLDRSNQRQKSFVADASHELRSPIAAAQTELEVSLTHFDSTHWPDSARTVLGDLERVRRIVDDLVILAHYDERAATPSPMHVDLDELVLRECTRLQRIAPILIDVSEVSGARVNGDAERLGRAIRNLLDNAVHHAQHQVIVTLNDGSGHVELRVRDDGPGVNPEDRARIFERFVRADSARSRSDGGSGLGLAIVSDIITAHGGTVEVVDAHPGAEFIIQLPSAE